MLTLKYVFSYTTMQKYIISCVLTTLSVFLVKLQRNQKNES